MTGRPTKSQKDKATADIRCKMPDAQKAAFIEAAKEDSFDEVSIWLKWLGQRRIRQLELERGFKRPEDKKE